MVKQAQQVALNTAIFASGGEFIITCKYGLFVIVKKGAVSVRAVASLASSLLKPATPQRGEQEHVLIWEAFQPQANKDSSCLIASGRHWQTVISCSDTGCKVLIPSGCVIESSRVICRCN